MHAVTWHREEVMVNILETAMFYTVKAINGRRSKLNIITCQPPFGVGVDPLSGSVSPKPLILRHSQKYRPLKLLKTFVMLLWFGFL